MRSLSPERSKGDNSIRHDKTFGHECRMRFYNTTRLERAFELECDKCAFESRRNIKTISNDFKHECPALQNLHCFSELKCLKSILCTSWRGVQKTFARVA